MSYVMDLIELADYFGLDFILKKCITFFYDTFTIEHLPVVNKSTIAKSSEFITCAINAFICRYFLKIVNSYTKMSTYSNLNFWCEYPIETIEYICALDLMINSEMQVFDAIMRWVNAYNRKCHLKRLLKLVRWCHLSEQDLSKIKENELFKSSGFEPIFCAPRNVNCACTFNRTKQNCFVMIEKLTVKDLRVKVLDNNFKQLFSQAIKEDTSIPTNFFHDEHISDILFDSGRKVIRIDWKQNKYNWVSSSQSYAELQKRIARMDESVCYNSECCGELELEKDIENSCLLFESTETFGLLRSEGELLHYFSMPTYQDYLKFAHHRNYEAILLGGSIYLLTKKFRLYELFIIYGELRMAAFYPLRNGRFRFEDLLFTPNPAGDKIFLINKYTRDYVSFDIKTKKKSEGQIASYSSADG